MDLKSLYRDVTEAIHRAEQFEDMKAPAAAMEFSNISILEERIAMMLPGSGLEGAIARRGAVHAAIDAKDYQRAKDLAARFAAERETDASLREELRKLRNRAVAMAARDRRATLAAAGAGDPSYPRTAFPGRRG